LIFFHFHGTSQKSNKSIELFYPITNNSVISGLENNNKSLIKSINNSFIDDYIFVKTCNPTHIKGNTNLEIGSFLPSQVKLTVNPKTFNQYNTYTYCYAINKHNYGYADLVFNSTQVTGTIRTKDYTYGIYPIDGDPFVHVLTIVNNDNYDGTCTSCCPIDDDSNEVEVFDVLEEAEQVSDDIVNNSDQFDETTDLKSIEDGTDLFFHEGNEVTFNRGPVCQTNVLVLYTNDVSSMFFGVPNPIPNPIPSIASLGINITEQILDNSEVTNVDLNLVGVDLYDLNENDHNNNINVILQFASNDEEVELLAQQYDADIIVILTETSTGFDDVTVLGTANAFFTFGSLPVVAVNVFHTSTPRYAFSHEIFHMYNAGHEDTHTYANAGEYVYTGPFDVAGDNLIQTMMYSNEINNDIPYVSNPDVTWNPPGIFTDEIIIGESWEDNSRMIEEQSCLVSLFDNAAEELVMNFVPVDNLYCYGSEEELVPFFVLLEGTTYPLQSLELEFSYTGLNYTEVSPENYGLYYFIGAFLFVVDIDDLNVDLEDNLYFKLTVTAFNGEEATDFASVEVGYCIASEEDNTMLVLPENENISFTSEVYPNPAGESLTVKELNGKESHITIRGVNGATYFNTSTNGTIDISHLVEGIYFLDYKVDESYKSLKFIKSN